MSQLRYLIDASSFKAEFPPTVSVPPLLVSFAEWLRENNVYIGAFRLFSERLGDASASGLGDLWQHFAPFMRTKCGSIVAFWLPDGVPLESPPVAMIGSEGDNILLGDSLEDFLWQLAAKTTGDSDLDSRDEESGDGSPALLRWLKSEGIDPKVVGMWPNFAEWWDARQTEYETFCDTDPLHLSIADNLRKIHPFPPDAKRWQTVCFDAVIVGARFQMWERRHGPQPLDHATAAELEPLLRADRERRAKRFPERGLWFQSFIRIGATGGARLNSEFVDQPKVLDELIAIPLREYHADLGAFPRSQYWMPKWL